MSTAGPIRTRSQRVASVGQQPGLLGRLWAGMREPGVLTRLGMCTTAALLLWLISSGWLPPWTYHEGQIPDRNIFPRTTFEQVDQEKTKDNKKRARGLTYAVFTHDPAQLDQVFAQLQHDVDILLGAEALPDVAAAIWKPFESSAQDEGSPSPEQQFDSIKEQLGQGGAKESFHVALNEALKQLLQTGILDALPVDHDANFQFVSIRPLASDDAKPVRNVAVDEVLLEPVTQRLHTTLKEKIPSRDLAEVVFRWLRAKLPITLEFDVEATLANQNKAEENVEPALRKYSPEPNADNLIAVAGEPITASDIQLLELEYAAILAEQTWLEKLNRSLAVFGFYVALSMLCGFYISSREPTIIGELRAMATLLGMVVATVGIAVLIADQLQGWQAELIPLILFGMTAAIAYRQELALLLSASVALVFVVSVGQTLSDALVLMAAMAGAILVLERIRSRSKLLAVGFVAAFVAFCASVGVGELAGMPFYPVLLGQGARLALWAVIAGSLMTCLLPLIEKFFGVQTDISLIELGDPAHPLLQELVRRSPGTYNHSITIASMAQTAAESIGARGLLVRVGAYFHDIGKMLKPGYFIENQTPGDNRHESLVPAMSTLVIIAHVKDGADLARQHHLPEPIIDFIQQHHGTTLVEFFYAQANQQQTDESGDTVDESTFRYPGPKPRTKEAAILMLADAVESASRVLAEPTPSRIESLVHKIAIARLEDGQFNECNITLAEIRKIEDSLAKSLTAVYHGRVKYPEPDTCIYASPFIAPTCIMGE